MFQTELFPTLRGAAILSVVIVLLLLTLTANPFGVSSNAVQMTAAAALRPPQSETPKSTGQTADDRHELDKPSPGDNIPNGWPVHGKVTSRFGTRRLGRRGEFHPGLDIAVPMGTDVAATASGEVVFASRQSGYGNLVIINHGNGVTTRYGHLSAISVTAGQQMSRGKTLGLSGNTGRSTGPHVHYEIRENGYPVNPLKSSGP